MGKIMIKKIRREFRKQLRLVKKFSNRIEAELAKEILEAYHINAYLFRNYFGQVTAIFVSAYDYPRAAQVLNLA
ncbi:hypothetical protein A3I50_04635 [Candidatus Roizmanbacteria bacterium RIFCSPLOWO2_02_FULL_37_9]|uniref:DUF2007 domain-containing protein n=1 Tax=Candidatus Roizmanbacteria bacterium RIFCSPLOWO2_01_FULL_37_16 TaxID=1802058 RepID=A0A1F7IPH7_9BACT|nr:MAG: hypothetical protein A3F57_06340 [Candidatus Roizmanbacteria bacterium RIFCSPHIGHO2_12_FULL_36_11]OGK45277.1 MAG: hypothetical protein A3B40_05020 [Candidatus Roizmanbacteria bacterium RIFCSPLOWO2_01_FULL_37_16]OGK56729.1 MAG: hypothetical protein A3I50_04635 [Candidatus Roizmanbacteria bacterium RIFCSPLOWO2_02_FULL_37_9]